MVRDFWGELGAYLVILIKPRACKFIFRSHTDAFLKVVHFVVQLVKCLFRIDAVLIEVDGNELGWRIRVERWVLE